MIRSDYTGGNRIDLLCSGAEYFPALLAAIGAARLQIFLETYIYADDATTQKVTDALAAAARRGVAVHVVIDGFGAREMPARFHQSLAAAGVALLAYRPPLWWRPIRGLRRMHRKIAMIDGEIAFVGGINIIDDWNAPHEVPPRHDYAVRVAGPVVAQVQQGVRRLWSVVALTALNRRKLPAAIPPPMDAGSAKVRFVTRDNLLYRRAIEASYLRAIGRARTDIVIAVAYFLPSRRFFHALRRAADRGVRIRIVMQGPGDHPLLQRATQFLYRRLLDMGVTIVEYRKSFLHAKVAVVDTAWATVGSSNLDPFSLMLSREGNIETTDARFAMTLRASLDAAIRDGGQQVTGDDLARLTWFARARQWASYRFARNVLGWLKLGR